MLYRHPVKENTVVVSPHSLGGDVPAGTEKSILKNAGIKSRSKQESNNGE